MLPLNLLVPLSPPLRPAGLGLGGAVAADCVAGVLGAEFGLAVIVFALLDVVVSVNDVRRGHSWVGVRRHGEQLDDCAQCPDKCCGPWSDPIK